MKPSNVGSTWPKLGDDWPALGSQSSRPEQRSGRRLPTADNRGSTAPRQVGVLDTDAAVTSRQASPPSAPITFADILGDSNAVARARNSKIIYRFNGGTATAKEVQRVTTAAIGGLGNDWQGAVQCLDALSQCKPPGQDSTRGQDGGEDFFPNHFHYTAAIWACEKAGRADKALALLRHIEEHGPSHNVFPNNNTYSAAISACAKAGEGQLALEVWQKLLKKGPARNVFPDAVTYGTMFSACERSGMAHKALEVLQHYLDNGAARREYPNTIDYNTVIRACEKSESGMADEVLALWRQMLALDPARGVFPDTTTYTYTISACAKAGRAEDALGVFRHMLALDPAHGVFPNTVTCNTTILACANAGRVEEALGLLHGMLALDPASGIFPDIITYNTTIAACEKVGRSDKALEVFQQLLAHGPAHGVLPDDITYNTAISACDKDTRLDKEARLAAADELLHKAVYSGVFKRSLGFNAKENKLNLHESAVVTQTAVTDRDKGVHSAVAKVIFRRLLTPSLINRNVINAKTEFVVGHRGTGALQQTIGDCMRGQGWNPVHPVVFDRHGIGRENLGALVAAKPSGLSGAALSTLDPNAAEFKPRRF